MTEILRLENVAKRFGEGDSSVAALLDVSLHLASGAFTAIRGPSGCGKTTLLLTAGGLLKPDVGGAVVSGQSLYALSVEKRAAFRAAHIGFVFQQFHLIPYLTVLENVLTPLLKNKRGTGRARAEELLNRFNLAGHARKFPAQLSTGERQRVALARALINHPSVLLADEPTGNLDEENGEAALNALSDFARQGGAVLLVTHDQKAAQRADCVMEMRNGALQQETLSGK
ncbi:MAG TPA: ABC transporter ATP-binding protein [Candidatus Hydrogenedentes bacterium]|nr:ABC transporter ATP-binding protein [Candidatus Hydrogenedentota bacterium]